jgi:hypothetical protein
MQKNIAGCFPLMEFRLFYMKPRHHAHSHLDALLQSNGAGMKTPRSKWLLLTIELLAGLM